MYTPKHFQFRDQEGILEFIKRFNFATIVSICENRPIATHLPFSVSKLGDDMVLTSHFAKANPQWKDLSSQQVLVIFTEPHAYISPSFYDNKENVPTWNYISVHAYGKAVIIEDEKDALKVLEEMIQSFEPSYKNQWGELSLDFKSKMVVGIVAFRIKVEEIQAKEKLSQNKTSVEQDNIINHFSASKSENERLIAEYMGQSKP